MAREFFEIEGGIRITGVNDDAAAVQHLFGTAVPGALAQENNAEVGSVYFRNGTAQIYQKTAAGSGTNKWTRVAFVTDITGLKWRSERVVVTTGDAVPGVLPANITAFADDDGGGPAVNNTGFVVGDFVIFASASGAVILEVTATSALDITVDTPASAGALTDNDAFVSKFYLPDSPASQEGQALIVYEGSTTSMLKIGDVNWDLATGINTSPSYTAGSGNPVSGDSVEAVLQKIDGNVDAVDSRQGLVQGAINFGAFTGGQNVLPNAATAKAILQAIADEVDTYKTAAAVTAPVVLDSVPIANYETVEWLVHAVLDSAPTRRKVFRIMALHDGATVVKEVVDKIRVGASFNTTGSIVINGTNMELQVAATAAVTFRSHRRHVLTAIN